MYSQHLSTQGTKAAASGRASPIGRLQQQQQQQQLTPPLLRPACHMPDTQPMQLYSLPK
jgi:hypothetical protein